MTRAKRMKPVQNLYDDTERRLAAALATIERKVADAEAKLQELERYRSDYDKQFAQLAGGGIGVTALRDYQAFLARLSEAIRQQQAVVKRAQSERDAERQRWQEAAKRAKALGHVVEQWQTEERQASNRREQHESDERAQRRVSRT
jgi:flagellar FliJ protein